MWAGISKGMTQWTVVAYLRPTRLADAVTKTGSNQGWCASIHINTCPTAPVAPITATLIFSSISNSNGHNDRWKYGTDFEKIAQVVYNNY